MIKRIIPIMLLSCLLGGCVVKITREDIIPGSQDNVPGEGDTQPGEGDDHPSMENTVDVLGDLTGTFKTGTELSHENNYDAFIAHMNKNDEGLVKSGYFRVVYAQEDGLDNHIFTTVGSKSSDGTFRITFEKRVKEVTIVLASYFKSYYYAGTQYNTYTSWFSVDAGGLTTTGFLRPNEEVNGPILNEVKLSMDSGNYIEVMGEMDKTGTTDYRVVIRSLSVSY